MPMYAYAIQEFVLATTSEPFVDIHTLKEISGRLLMTVSWVKAASGTVYYLPFGAIGTASQPMVNYLTTYTYGQMASMVSN
jgi:hypothetical protein